MRIFLGIVLFAIVIWALLAGPLRNPGKALEEFEKQEHVPEPLLEDPLILAGPGVKPLVLEAIADRNMPLRFYALDYLGCAGYAPAEGVLRAIAEDAKEDDSMRMSALNALVRLDPQAGLAVERSVAASRSRFGVEVESVFAQDLAPCRGWVSALIHSLD